MSQEIVGELSFDPSILEKVKANPRFLELVKTFVTESAALTVRIANEIPADAAADEDAEPVQWQAHEMSQECYMLLTCALGIVIDKSFGHAQPFWESWGYSVSEILGSTALSGDAEMSKDHGGLGIGDVLDDWAYKIQEIVWSDSEE